MINKNEIKVKNQMMKYELYLIATNLEHLLFNDRNFPANRKKIEAQRFSIKYRGKEIKFIEFLAGLKLVDSYKHYFDDIKVGDNSLKRSSNLYYLLKKED